MTSLPEDAADTVTEAGGGVVGVSLEVTVEAEEAGGSLSSAAS